MNSFALLAVAALCAMPANACLNDRDSDSLATQAAQLPETLRVITGRFPRNPPLYYQMRIQRERAALAATPKQFGLYNDIGVALDKLGRDDEALQTMNAKRAQLPAFNPNDKTNRENWYRTFANAGTFRAHRYLKSGAPVEKLGEMKTARAQIKRAIEIKPDAHFGRERYQLMAMDWIIARKSNATKKTLGEWISGRDGWKKPYLDTKLKDDNRGRAVEGLSGLIVLGGAWESPDVFEALGAALETKDGVTLRFIAFSRAKELLESGKPSLAKLTLQSPQLSPEAGDLYDYGVGVNDMNQGDVAQLFIRLRAEADNWNLARQNWMTNRLKSGNHPYTDPNFWRGYVAGESPSLQIDWQSQRARSDRNILIALVMAALIFIGIPISLIIAFIWWRKRNSVTRPNLT